MNSAIIMRRTFEAERHAKGTTEREALNLDALTSEYYHGSPYLVRRRSLMSDGTQHPTQSHLNTLFRTKREAAEWCDHRRGWTKIKDDLYRIEAGGAQ